MWLILDGAGLYQPRKVTLSLANGKALGLKLKKNPDTGKGPAVKSIDPGGQAEATGKVREGDIITHINGTD
jgi:C-terminal processing protease CtpA/Prc